MLHEIIKVDFRKHRGQKMASPEQFPHVNKEEDTDQERLDDLEKRIRRIELWVPIFLAVAVGVTALATLILKVSMLVGAR